MLRRRFNETADDARKVLQALGPQDVPADVANQWRRQLARIDALLDGPADTALDRERVVTQEFRTLERLNAEIAQAVQRTIGERNDTLQTQLDASRQRATRVVVAASCGVSWTQMSPRSE